LAQPDIFLSYNREDAEVAQRFAEGFEAAGFDVWWDQALRSGDAYDKVTEAALRGAKAVVVLWSPHSVVSRWVRAEATLADRNRTLVPARIGPCDLPIMFELTQTAELSHWDGDTTDRAWQAFLTDVNRFVEASSSRKDPTPQPSAVARSRPPPRSTRPSIAVLPFVNRSGIAEDDIFADCMAEDLTAALSVSRRIKITASSATAGYRDSARDLRQIGRDVGVRYLLEGNVRRVGTNLRVTAQLEEAETSDILWTQKFDRPLEDRIALQEELATEVAAHLGAEVQRVAMEQALRKSEGLTAWEAVLRSDAFVTQNTLSSFQAAVAEARRAVMIDPEFGAAYASLASALAVLLGHSGSDDPAIEEEIIESIERARAFGPNNPLVLLRIASALYNIGRPQAGLPLVERAVEINPSLEGARLVLGSTLMRLGRWEEAIDEFETVTILAPRGYWFLAAQINLAMTHILAGHFEQALHYVDQTIKSGDLPVSYAARALCLEKLDRADEARKTIVRLRDAHPDITWEIFENVIRREPMGSDPKQIDGMISILRRFWEQTEGEV